MTADTGTPAGRDETGTLVFKYRIPGVLPPEAMAEIRRAHVLRNKITEIYRQGDDRLSALYESSGLTSAAQQQADEAGALAETLAAEVRRRKAAGRTARPDPVLAARLAEARAAATAARARLKDVKAAARVVLRDVLGEMRRAQEQEIKALYGQAVSGALYGDDPLAVPAGGLFWASFNVVAARRQTAFSEVIKSRARGLPAELRFRRWEGGAGTIAVQLQRELGERAVISFAARQDGDPAPGAVTVARQVTAGDARHVTAAVTRKKQQEDGSWRYAATIVNRGEAAVRARLRADMTGLLASGAAVDGAELAAPCGDLRRDGPVLSWEGTLAGGPPLRTPARLADPAGRYRNLMLLIPYGEDARPWQRKRAALRFRIRSARPGTRCREHALDDQAAAAVARPAPDGHGRLRYADPRTEECEACGAAWVTVPMIAHRPLPDDCEVTGIEVTCRREGTSVRASAQVTVTVPEPSRPAGGHAAAVHCGWRVLDGGSLRVAAVRGVTAPAPDLAWVVPAKGRKPARRIPVIRGHGDWHEIVIPAEARDLVAKADSIASIRSRNQDTARAAVLKYLAGHPEHKPLLDPDGTAGLWRSPGRFRRLAGAAAAIPEAAILRAALGEYLRQDLHLERWEAGNRQRYVRWRDDAWRQVAAWVTDSAGMVTADEWEMRRQRPDAGEEETPQARLARANAALAAPGELRAAVGRAAQRRGVPVAGAPEGVSGIHHGCPAGGVLDADERRETVVVCCRGCGRMVDQDSNATAGMLRAARQ